VADLCNRTPENAIKHDDFKKRSQYYGALLQIKQALFRLMEHQAVTDRGIKL
jgi:hypothetical protein